MTKHLRTIQEVREIIKSVDEMYGTNINDMVEVECNARLTRALGRCSYRGFKPYKLDFSKVTMNMDYEPFRQIVLHEVAHALTLVKTKTCNHDETFRRFCKQIGCKNDRGVNTDREAVAKAKERLGINTTSTKSMSKPYVLHCTNCGHNFTYSRRGKYFTRVETYGEKAGLRCGACNSPRLEARIMR